MAEKTSNGTKAVRVQTIATGQSKDKLDKSYLQTKVLSVQIFCKDNAHRIRFLFDTNFTGEVWEKAIDNLFVLLDNHFSENPKDEISMLIERNNFHSDMWGALAQRKLIGKLLILDKSFRKVFRKVRKKMLKA